MGAFGYKLYSDNRVNKLKGQVSELKDSIHNLTDTINNVIGDVTVGDVTTGDNNNINVGSNINYILKEYDRPGHAGDIIQCVEDPSVIYTSKVKAARAIGISEKTLRSRLKDKLPINGKTYEHVGSFNADDLVPESQE